MKKKDCGKINNKIEVPMYFYNIKINSRGKIKFNEILRL